MQFPRNCSSSHRNDKIQWNDVIKYFYFHSVGAFLSSRNYFSRVISILEWFLPDIVMLISTPSIYLLLRRLTITDTPDIEAAGSTIHAESGEISNENLNILKKIGELID